MNQSVRDSRDRRKSLQYSQGSRPGPRVGRESEMVMEKMTEIGQMGSGGLAPQCRLNVEDPPIPSGFVAFGVFRESLDQRRVNRGSIEGQ